MGTSQEKKEFEKIQETLLLSYFPKGYRAKNFSVWIHPHRRQR